MKAITVWQPWATLLATGKKRIETRSWKTSYRGEILIHAGKPKKNFFDEIYADGEVYPFFREAGIVGHKDFFEPSGMIIGKAKLVNCVRIDELTAQLIKEQHPDEFAFGDFSPGRYAWLMEGAALFEKPIPATGKQGLWNFAGTADHA